MDHTAALYWLIMTDIDLENFLDYQTWGYHDFHNSQDLNQLSGTIFLNPHTASRLVPAPVISGPDDIELTYTELHKRVDQVYETVSIGTPPRLDRIREQNRQLIDKLTALESLITGDTTPHVSSADVSLPALPHQALGSSRQSGGGGGRRVSHSIGVGTPSASTPETSIVSLLSKLVSAIHARDVKPFPPCLLTTSQDLSPSPPLYEFDIVSKLAKKILQIGNEEARRQVADFAAQLKAPECQSELPNIFQFSNTPRITDVSHFRRVVVDLGLAIESSIFGEQNSRIKKRIALAHFYHAYTLAQDHPETFLTWCDDQRVLSGSILPKGGNKSVVQHRFADLIFTRGVPSANAAENCDDAKRKIAKIQMWRKSGKKWAMLIQRFGCGILLLLPHSFSDEE